MKNEVTLVTGAAWGIGLTTARAFAQSGAIAVLSDINEPAQQAEELVKQGFKAMSIQCDVSDERQVKTMIGKIVVSCGRLDAAYNNAGINSPVAETANTSSEGYDRVMNINLRGIWNCMKYELRQMRQQESGAIVNCSSIGRLIGIAERGVYQASKHGVIGLTKSAALEYAAKGININAACPGIIQTPMLETITEREPEALKALIEELSNRRPRRPEEVARAVLWLCRPAASLVIGHAIAVDGGYTVK